MNCIICNGDTNQSICPVCINRIGATPELIELIKVKAPKPLTTAEAVAKCIDALVVQFRRGQEDPETSGRAADTALCAFINDLGFPRIVELYNRVAHY